MLEDITDDIYGGRNILSEALRVVYCLLSRGVGVEMGTKVLYFELQRVLRTTASSFESHMLKEVSSAIGLVCLRPTSGIDPHADSGSLGMGLRFGGHCKTI
jgi:hypothetical protein